MACPASSSQAPSPAVHDAKSSKWIAAAALIATVVFCLAYFSPVEMVDSDAAMTLLSAQALIEHGTLDLTVYAAQPNLAYDLESDYRLEHHGTARLHRLAGLSILSAPMVAVARLFGADMLRQQDEQQLQNLLSALSCAAILLLLFAACRTLVGPPAGLVIAALSVLGSGLISTLATAFWNVDLAVLFVALALAHLARSRTSRPSASWLVLLSALAVAARPSTAFFALALPVAYAKRPWRALALGGSALALLTTVTWALGRNGLLVTQDLHAYYSPIKLRPQTPWSTGLPGILISPSRGLLVFSPFLVPLCVAAARLARQLWRVPLFRLSVLWPLMLVAAVSVKVMWWGGHAYGPRLLTEIMPAFAILAALVWSQRSALDASSKGNVGARHTWFAATYLATGLLAVWINSYQGLFQTAVRRWNIEPNVDAHTELLFDWRYPQFAATNRAIDRRLVDIGWPWLHPYRLGGRITFDSERAVFSGWYPAESDWRWSRGHKASVWLRLPAPARSTGLCVLELEAGAQGKQRVEARVGTRSIGRFELEGFEPQHRILAFQCSLLDRVRQSIELRLSDPRPAPEDDRQLGIALRWLEISAVEGPFPGVAHEDDRWFGQGFAASEEDWRWTVAREAEILYPILSADPRTDYAIRLTARSVTAQTVEVELNEKPLSSMHFDGFAPTTRVVGVPGSSLRSGALNRLTLRLPGAAPTPEDPRLLGLALVRVAIEPATPGETATTTVARNLASDTPRPSTD